MATYYVSKSGNDGNAGTSEALAWLTVTKAAQTASAGDTVYVAPGIYRESPTNSNAGTSENIIYFIADPDCQHCTNNNPGIVRVTNNDTDENIVSGSVWTCRKDYVEIDGFYIDGGSDYALDRGAMGNGRIARNCILSGITSGNYGIFYNCVVFGAGDGILNAVCYNCLSICASCAFSTCTCYNCIGFGSYASFYNGSAYNCLGIGGQYGICEVTSYNCISAFGYTGFYSGTANYGYAVNSNQFGFYSVAKSNCRYVKCFIGSSGGSGDAPTLTSTVLWSLVNMQKIIEAFKPWMFEGAKQWGTTSGITVPDTDILGLPRQMIGGGLDIGPYAYTVEEADWSTYSTDAPSIKISQKGAKVFKLPAEVGTAITITCKCKHQNTSGDKPQLILKGESISEQTDTCINDTDTWDTLTVSATPTKDEELEVILYARDTGSIAVAYFSDIEVS